MKKLLVALLAGLAIVACSHQEAASSTEASEPVASAPVTPVTTEASAPVAATEASAPAAVDASSPEASAAQ